jgi:two-component system, NarL family, sensor histidine kinase DesK
VSERDALVSMRRYTRLTLLSTMPVFGLAPLIAVSNGVDWRLLPVPVIAVTVLVTVHWKRVARAIEEPAEVPPWRPSAVTLAMSVVLLAYMYIYVDPGNGMWAMVAALPVAELQFGRTAAASWRLTAGLACGIGGLVGAIGALTSTEPNPLVTTGVTVFLLVVTPFAEMMTLRQWRIAVELDQARRDAAELGATRERLRFAEDLHDILGHALEVVSLKAELATRVRHVDPDRAHAEMVEVQRLARGALEDVRGLVQGRSGTDLDTELAGARSLLASAGIGCVVDVEPADQRHSDVLGRVLREAITNLLRHADTTCCWITVRPAALTVVNDGVTSPSSGPGGTGLASLARRVSAAGGKFTAGPGEQPGTFSVSAVLT